MASVARQATRHHGDSPELPTRQHAEHTLPRLSGTRVRLMSLRSAVTLCHLPDSRAPSLKERE